MKCERCHNPKPVYTTGSYFNTEQICEKCDAREQAHPRYEEARRTEERAVRGGNFNFRGIGLPADL
jgi:hypothetical protein